MTQLLRSSLFRRIMMAILATSLLPVLIIGGMALWAGNQAGRESISLSQAALDEKSAAALELRAVETAQAIADFLEEREGDLRALALLPRTDSIYLEFYQSRQDDIWLVEDGQEVRPTIPLYREIAFVRPDGREQIKVLDGALARGRDLRDVSDPANTLFLSETYFQEALGLAPGEISIGHITGFYVNRDDFERGERFLGVVRFAMPVYEGGSLEGIVVLALDSRHLAEFTQHIVPTEEQSVAAPDAATGNYAYFIDDLAQTVAHPNEFLLWGLAEDGSPLEYATRNEELGMLPVRLDHLGFADENLASIPALAATGEPGSLQYHWSGHDKFVAYAPIPYYGGGYQEPAGFGWIGISADVATFHSAATLVGEAIRSKVAVVGGATLVIVGLTGGLVLLVAGALARSVWDPIQRITDAARRVERNDFHLDVLDPLLNQQREDELIHLARVFTDMAGHVRQREQIRRLLDAVINIGVALPEEKNFNRLLETIVLDAKSLCEADGATLYLRTADNLLRFVILRNDTLNTAMGGTTGDPVTLPPVPLFDETGAPNLKNVASYTAHKGVTVNIPDVATESRFDFSGAKAYEEQTGYHSRSFLCVPLCDSASEVIGVIQLINARDPETGAVTAFEPGMNRVIESLAALGTVALRAYMREAELKRKIEELRIEVDEVRREEQVSEITESEYFQILQQRARSFRGGAKAKDAE